MTDQLELTAGAASPGLRGAIGDQPRRGDFRLLQAMFADAAQALFPVPVLVEFWIGGPGEVRPSFWSAALDEEALSACGEHLPRVAGDILILPLLPDAEFNVAAIASAVEVEIANRMSREWLIELCARLDRALVEVRHTYVDPPTSLYNSRLLPLAIQGLLDRQTDFSLLLIGVIGPGGTATEARRAHLLAADVLVGQGLSSFYHLGSGVFALVCEGCASRTAVRLGRRLAQRLRRVVRKVHVGVHGLVADGQGGAEEVISHCWHALEDAGRQGPFGLAIAVTAEDRRSHPLRPESEATLAALSRCWRGKRCYALARIIVDDPGQVHSAAASPLTPLLMDQAHVVEVSPTTVYVLLDVFDQHAALAWAGKFQKQFAEHHASATVSVGIALYPCASLGKTAVASHCAKALLHAGFLGPGSVVVFDHVSCNVSGDRFFDDGDLHQAVRDYRLGLRLWPDDLNLLNSLGVALAEMSRHRQAIACFDRVLSADSGNPMALVNLGNSYSLLDDHAAALTCLEKAMGLYEGRRDEESLAEFADLLLRLARLYCLARRHDKALETVSRFRQVSPGREEFSVCRLLGEACMALGRDQEAMRALQQALCFHPHDAESLGMLGELYLRAGQGDDIALSLCQQAVEKDPANVSLGCRLARVLLHMGLVGRAEEIIRHCLRQDRRHPVALMLLADTHIRRGHKRRGRKMYERLLARCPDGDPLGLELDSRLSAMASEGRRGNGTSSAD